MKSKQTREQNDDIEEYEKLPPKDKRSNIQDLRDIKLSLPFWNKLFINVPKIVQNRSVIEFFKQYNLGIRSLIQKSYPNNTTPPKYFFNLHYKLLKQI